MDNLPCPFCGGKDLMPTQWSVGDEEVDALECVNCYAGAPVTSWNKRASNILSMDDAELICDLKRTVTMRGARMQILYDLLYNIVRFDSNQDLIVKSWFDVDGTPL